MVPDFNKNTIEVLAKRAGYICSNPDCRIATVGPNSNPSKSTLIGEAAHIRGARKGSKRYIAEMTDIDRASITNGIWLCRNCHKLIDSDPNFYKSETLFEWREIHEKFILHKLGNVTCAINQKEQEKILSEFNNYPHIIRRIILDKPAGWEFKLTAELMRYLNEPAFKKLEDINDGLYFKANSHIEKEDVFNWVQKRLGEASNLIPPFVNLINKLNKSWGDPGEEGDIKEIHHITGLIKEHLNEVIKFEETIHFVIVDETFKPMIDLLKDLVGSQVRKLSKVPEDLDKIVQIGMDFEEGKIDKPDLIKNVIEFSIPDKWEKTMNYEMQKAYRLINKNNEDTTGCIVFIFLILLFIIIYSLL